jgi:hypothetical protein
VEFEKILEISGGLFVLFLGIQPFDNRAILRATLHLETEFVRVVGADDGPEDGTAKIGLPSFWATATISSRLFCSVYQDNSPIFSCVPLFIISDCDGSPIFPLQNVSGWDKIYFSR